MKTKLKWVLLVDDNDADNYIHKMVLEQSGVTERVEVALNGVEALNILTGSGKVLNPDGSVSWPDLIFLDINMPVMDGWEFLEDYAMIPDVHKHNVVIVLLTTSLNPGDKLRAEKLMENGCFLYKPLTPELVDQVMRQSFPDRL